MDLLPTQALSLPGKLSQLGTQQSARAPTHQHVSQELWEMSDLLRLSCTRTKSPVCPQCTTFAGSSPFLSCARLCWVHGAPLLLGSHVPASKTWLPSTGRDSRAQPSAPGNKPPFIPKASQSRNVLLPQSCAAAAVLFCRAKHRETARPHHSNLIFKAREITLAPYS